MSSDSDRARIEQHWRDAGKEAGAKQVRPGLFTSGARRMDKAPSSEVKLRDAPAHPYWRDFDPPRYELVVRGWMRFASDWEESGVLPGLSGIFDVMKSKWRPDMGWRDPTLYKDWSPKDCVNMWKVMLENICSVGPELAVSFRAAAVKTLIEDLHSFLYPFNHTGPPSKEVANDTFSVLLTIRVLATPSVLPPDLAPLFTAFGAAVDKHHTHLQTTQIANFFSPEAEGLLYYAKRAGSI
ncbi:hypothetical protein DIPPA_06776 [Diplonema papillatum]|nr:hypothetical protein DIPPA_06776 [Diplonema papillatum]|eukprot:gene11217-17252_t